MNYIETYLNTDFPNSEYNIDSLVREIEFSSISGFFSHVNAISNMPTISVVEIIFTDELNSSEKNILDNIIANHDMNFGVIIEDLSMPTPTIELVDDISFNTPRTSPLPSSNQSYTNISVLGQNGPNLSNVTQFSFTWDLNNENLNSFNLSTNNGNPGWWVNLIPLSTHTFASPQPDLILENTNIPNLDGEYWINYYEDGLALVSKLGDYSIYLSNSPSELEYIPKEYEERFLVSDSEHYIKKSPIYFNVYGSSYKFIKDYDEQSTTSENYQTAISLDSDLELGNYKIIVSHRYGMSVTNNQFYSRVALNGEPIGSEFISRENRNVNRKINQFIFVETLEGQTNIELQYRRTGGTAFISDMIIEIFRVN